MGSTAGHLPICRFCAKVEPLDSVDEYIHFRSE